jgi:heterodisulfide reductase subunit B
LGLALFFYGYIIQSKNKSSITDCPFVVLLTKCDQVSKSLNSGRQSIFEDNDVKDCMQRLVEEFGFKQYQIHPIVNYNDHNIVDKEIDRLILGKFVFNTYEATVLLCPN